MGTDAPKVLLEEAFDELADLDIVIDDGNQGLVGVVLKGGGRRFVLCSVGQDGQQERKGCALLVRIDTDLASMQLDVLLDDRQADTGALIPFPLGQEDSK